MVVKKIFVMCVFVLGVSFSGYAQSGIGDLFGGASDQKGIEQKPTKITSEQLEYKPNLAIFIGNVVALSPEFSITCERMELSFEEIEVKGKKKRELKFIRCYQNMEGTKSSDTAVERVEIVRNQPAGKDAVSGSQKGIAGEVVYNVVSGEIVLTGKPVLVQGMNEIRGDKITVWRDSDKMHVAGDVKTRFF